MLGYLLRNRKVWGLTIGFAAYGYSFYLFLTWLPGYLVSEMHMSIIKSAGYAAIPWLFATISDLVVGGWLIDHLLAKGYDDTKTRKTVLVGGMVLGLAVFGATMDDEPGLGDCLDHDRAQRACGGRAGRLVDSLAHRSKGRHRHDRRRHELRQQSHGRDRSGGHRLRRRRDEFLLAQRSWWRGSCC